MLPSTTKGKGQIVALVDAHDNPNVATDLSRYRAKFGLPTAHFTKYNQNGQRKNYPEGSPGWGVEIDLDAEMVSASCPNCAIYLVEANSSAWNDLETAETEAVKLGAHIVSNSWAGTGGDSSYFDAAGVTYLGADGNGGLNEPAIFGDVIAVGGTVLVKGGGGKRGWSESVWASGDGGCLTGATKPPWQHDRYCGYRLANDVAAVAEDVAGYDSYDETGWISVNGTAVATPFLAGVFGLAGNAARQEAGRTFWLRSHHRYLYPVTVGASECAYSHGGYNTCAGWGSPDGVDAF